MYFRYKSFFCYILLYFLMICGLPLLFLFFLNLFIYFWLCWIFIAAWGFSLVAVSRGYSLLRCAGGFSLWSTGSRHTGFSSCSTPSQQLWYTGLVAPGHVGFSLTGDQTDVGGPYIGKPIFIHCTTRWVLHFVSCVSKSVSFFMKFNDQYFLSWLVILGSSLRNLYLMQGCTDFLLCFPILNIRVLASWFISS